LLVILITSKLETPDQSSVVDTSQAYTYNDSISFFRPKRHGKY